jgi:uncharacterized protein
MRYTLFYALFLITISSFGQAEQFKGEHFIEVSGVAETEIDPNEITLIVVLREFEENKAKVQLEKLDQEFFNAIKAAGIDRKKVTLADAGSRLGRVTRRDKDAFRQKSYQIILSSAAEVEKLIEKLEPVQVSQLDITKIHHTDFEKYKLDTKIKALQAAKSKAEALLKSIGSEVGKPLMVREWDHEPVQPYENVRYKMHEEMQATDMAAAPSGVEFRKLRIRMQVTAQFEIK